jgi:hypothetical protein
VEKATYVRRLIHGRQSKDTPVSVSPFDLPIIDAATIGRVDPLASLEELSARLMRVVTQLSGLLTQTVTASSTLKAQHLTRKRLDRLRKEVLRLKAAHQRGEDLGERVAQLRAGIEMMLTAASDTGDLQDVGQALLGELSAVEQALSQDPQGVSGALENLDERLTSIGNDFERTVVDTAAQLIAGGSVPFYEISQHGFEKALCVLPEKPTFAETTKIVGLLDQIVIAMSEKLNRARESTEAMVDHCAVLAAAFVHPETLRSIVASNSGNNVAAIQALARGLQITEAQATIIYEAYTDASESFSGLVSAVAGKIGDGTQWDWLVQDHAIALRTLASHPEQIHSSVASASASGADVVQTIMDGWLLTAKQAQIVIQEIQAIAAFDAALVGTYLDHPIKAQTAMATRLLQAVTDKEGMVIFTPHYLKAESAGRPGWTLNVGGLDSHSLDYLEPYRHVRAPVENALSLFEDDTSLRLYEDRRQQRPDGEGVSGRSEGNTDCLYLASPAQLSGECLTCLMIDDWREGFPNMQETTGIAVRYDSPEAEAPHAILLAVPPRLSEREEWTVDLLANTLLETIELMQVRMVGSADIIGSDLGRYFPALLFGPGSDGKALFPVAPRLLFDFDIGARHLYVPSERLTAAERKKPEVTAARGSGVELDA